MSKKLNLLPIVLLLILLCLGGYLLLKDDLNIDGLKSDDTLDIKRVESFPNKVYTAKQMEKQRRIIKSQEELDAFFNEIDESDTLKFNEKVDFDKEWVIAVTPDLQENDGHAIKIKKIEIDKEDNSYKVVIVNTKPGDNCEGEYEATTTLPVDLAVVEKKDLETAKIEFESVIEEKPCKPSSLDLEEDTGDQETTGTNTVTE